MNGYEAQIVFNALLGGATPHRDSIQGLVFWIVAEHQRRENYDRMNTRQALEK